MWAKGFMMRGERGDGGLLISCVWGGGGGGGQSSNYSPTATHPPARLQMGEDGVVGHCRKSCSACVPCGKGDWDCINANRKKQGYLPMEKQELDWLGVGDLLEGHSPEL